MQDIDSEIIQFASSIHIKIEEVEPFMLAWENLMSTFKIPEDNQPSLFFILKNFFTTLDSDFETIYELNNALAALDFFISYRDAMDSIKAKHGDSPKDIEELLQLQLLAFNLPITFNYPGGTSLTVQLLYRFLRTNDIQLMFSLEPYSELPSLLILNEIREKLTHNQEYKHQHWLIDTVEQLKGYITSNLSKILSRKINLFVFEVLYLFDILQYAGKINDSDSAKYKLPIEPLKAKFNPLRVLTESQKTDVVKTLIINAKKVAQYEQDKL